MASMAIYSIKGHLLFYFPKFDLIIATHDNIGFILVDVSKGKQKSHYFGLNFLKQAGKIEHFKYYINEPYLEEASTIDWYRILLDLHNDAIKGLPDLQGNLINTYLGSF